MIQLTLEDMASALTLRYLKLSACGLNTQICREKALSAHVLWIEHGENAKNDLKRPQPGRDVQIHFQSTSIRINFLKEQVVKPFIERKESRDEWMTIIIKLLFMFSPPCMFMFPIIWMWVFFFPGRPGFVYIWASVLCIPNKTKAIIHALQPTYCVSIYFLLSTLPLLF